MAAYQTPSEQTQDMQAKANHIQQWVPILQSRNIPIPVMIDGEPLHNQRKRVLEMVRHVVSDDLQKVKRDHIFESGLDHIERQFQESAAEEARHPTRVPDGTLKEVRRMDDSGRAIIEFFGRPMSWMSQFSNGTKKRLVGIKTRTETGYHPFNVG